MAFAFRFFRRLLAFAAYGAAIGALVFILWPLLPIPTGGSGGEGDNANAAETPAQTVPARPKGIPARIPPWAWDLHKWLATSPDQRGARPKAAPAHVPTWFWTWRKWRLELAPAR